MTMTMVTGTDLLAPDQDPDGDGRDEAAVAELAVVKPANVRECLADDTGATTAEYAITTLAAFGVYGVGFLARPFGGLFFGTIGDRIGRRWVLVTTIILMGGASTLIGALPTYEQVGMLAPILLVVMRLLQGFGAGAEQAGATVLMAEYSPVKKRGFFSALPFVGIQAGTLLASVVFFLLTLMPEEAFLSWGWRLPFLGSFVLILVALFIRAKLQETPSFVQLEKSEQVAERPVREIFTRGRAGVVIGVGLRMAENGGSYMFQSIALAFVTSAAIGMDRGAVTWGVTFGSLIGIFSVPLTGKISDRVGRVPVYRFGAVFMLLFAFPAWYLLSLGNELIAVGVIAIGLGIAVNTMLGPQCAMLPEMFGNRHRYLGVAMAREISAVLAGGLAGVLGAALLAWTDGNWIVLAIYMATLAAITTASTFLVPETRGRDLMRIEDAVRISTTEQDTATSALPEPAADIVQDAAQAPTEQVAR